MPIYEFECKKCCALWEDLCKISVVVEELKCPECEVEGSAKKLISLIAKGRVKLTGHEYKQKIKSEADSLKREMKTNEDVMANMYGESKYNEMRKESDKLRNELANIGKQASQIKSVPTSKKPKSTKSKSKK